MLGVTWCRAAITRRSGRVMATAAGVAIAVALLASIGTFLAGSKATMTRRAVQNVPVDWQVEAQPGVEPVAFLHTVAAHTQTALPVDFAQTTGLRATTSGATQTTGPGVVVGLPSAYRATFPDTIRDLAGARAGVLIAQQTAANLHVAPGDTITVGRAGASSFDVRVGGMGRVAQGVDNPHVQAGQRGEDMLGQADDVA